MILLCREVAAKVSREVTPLIGKVEAGDVLGMGADGSPTKRIDKVAEDCAISVLKDSGVPMVVLSEEAGLVELCDDPEHICLLDPVDGTYNAVKGIPFFSFSIAFARWSEKATLGDLESALVLNIGTGEEFSSVKGQGATQSGQLISSSGERVLTNAAFSVYHQGEDMVGMMELCQKLKRTRTLGSVALELCYVANGSLEGVVDLRGRLKITDVAAGKLILEEAGGKVTDGFGKALEPGLNSLRIPNLLACGSAAMHENALRVLRGEKS